MTFFTAPHSSTPTTSSFVYGRKYADAHARATSWAVASLRRGDHASRSAAARRSRAPGWARRRRRSGRVGIPSDSATTSLMRRSVASSTPFISETADGVRGATASASGVEGGAGALRRDGDRDDVGAREDRRGRRSTRVTRAGSWTPGR